MSILISGFLAVCYLLAGNLCDLTQMVKGRCCPASSGQPKSCCVTLLADRPTEKIDAGTTVPLQAVDAVFPIFARDDKTFHRQTILLVLLPELNQPVLSFESRAPPL